MNQPPAPDRNNVKALLEYGFDLNDVNFALYLEIYEYLLGGTEPITKETILEKFAQIPSGGYGGGEA